MKEITAAAILLTLCQLGYTMESCVLAKERRTRSPGTIEIIFELAEIPKGRQVRLGLDARVDWLGLAGSNPWTPTAGALPSRLSKKSVKFTAC